MKKFLQVYSAMVKRALLKYTKVMANRYWWKREESKCQMGTVKFLRAMSALSTLFFFLPYRSIYSNSPPTKSLESSGHLKTNSITKLHVKLKKKKIIHRAIYLPKSLKNEAISCRWMTKVGVLVILTGRLSSVCWLVRLVPVGLWVPWPWALFSWRRLLTWRECGLSLGVTQTVTEGGVRRHVLVCFIPAPFRSSDSKGASWFGERKQKCNMNSTNST